jgi:hypothetical protein
VIYPILIAVTPKRSSSLGRFFDLLSLDGIRRHLISTSTVVADRLPDTRRRTDFVRDMVLGTGGSVTLVTPR